ncbi:unnamed protein product, partial [Dovyalis caffra]
KKTRVTTILVEEEDFGEDDATVRVLVDGEDLGEDDATITKTCLNELAILYHK